MRSSKFVHFDLELAEPTFSSSLTDLIIELDYLRRKKIRGTTHPEIFFQLKHIFHFLESIGSARIEGNNTTVAEYIETKLEGKKKLPYAIKEIQNIEDTMAFVEKSVKNHSINRAFVSEMHRMITDGLLPPPDGEGDHAPGNYRTTNLRINMSDHTPPDFLKVGDYMEELFNFIHRKDSPKYDLLKIAIAHHRFVWIHPFGNGNGRTVRLFTYAMLVKLGFNVDEGRILNPTAVFCSNRDAYYKYLSMADKGTKKGILEWSEYVLKGLKEEIEKIDKLLNYDYLKKEILLPAINDSVDRKYITDTEAKVLKKAVESQVIQAADMKDIFVGKSSQEVSRQIRKLIEKKMLMREGGDKTARKYLIRFDNNYLLRSVIKLLGKKGFLPLRESI